MRRIDQIRGIDNISFPRQDIMNEYLIKQIDLKNDHFKSPFKAVVEFV